MLLHGESIVHPSQKDKSGHTTTIGVVAIGECCHNQSDLCSLWIVPIVIYRIATYLTAVYNNCVSWWSTQLQCDLTLPPSVKNVACETRKGNATVMCVNSLLQVLQWIL